MVDPLILSHRHYVYNRIPKLIVPVTTNPHLKCIPHIDHQYNIYLSKHNHHYQLPNLHMVYQDLLFDISF